MLNEDDSAYVRRRMQRQRWGPWAVVLLLAAVLGLWGYLFLSRSLLVNPWALLERVENDAINQGTLTALALLGCIGFLALGIVMLGVLALLGRSMRSERRLLDIIRKLTAG